MRSQWQMYLLPGIGVSSLANLTVKTTRMRSQWQKYVLPGIGVGALANLADVARLSSSHIHITLKHIILNSLLSVK